MRRSSRCDAVRDSMTIEISPDLSRSRDRDRE